MSDQQSDINLLTAQIGDRDTARQAYPVRVTLGDGSAASGWLRPSDLPPLPQAQLGGSAMATYGLAVFACLFPGPLLGLFRQAWIAAQRTKGVLHVQLWIQSDEAELQAVPWELMHFREGAAEPTPLAATPQVAFSRYVDSATPFGRPIERWPLRVLIAIGAPSDIPARWPGLAAVNYEAERAKIERVLHAVSASGQVEYQFIHPATPEALMRKMDEGYQIVIFFGHGLYMPRLGTSLMMEREGGGSKLLAAGDLIDALRRNGSRPALFILISCNTASQHANPSLDNLAIQIIRDGSVPAVVAMRDLVAVDLARAFTQYLCDYLLRYGMIDRAVSAARRQVMDGDSAGWSTPVLYMRSRDGRLFVPNAQLEFARLLSNDPQISPAALAAQAGARLALMRARPDDQPNPQDARALLGQLLAVDGPRASPAPVVVSGGSRISRALLLQQWGWGQNRVATPPVAVYVPLADDRSLQAGGRIEDLLIDAASAVDPAHGVALMNLLSDGRDSGGARFVLLIDGLEAVTGATRGRIANLLCALARRMPAQRIVISVDEQAAPDALRQSDTAWLLLQPLSERQMRAYLSYRDQVNRTSHIRTIIRGGMRDLASDPQLLTAIAEALTDGGAALLSRDDLLNSLLDRVIDRAAGPTASRGMVRDGLYALAWALHWSHRRSMPTAEAFQIIRAMPQDQFFAPEEIYRALVSSGALVEVGGAQIQLSHIHIQAYAAARALRRRPDIPARLEDVVVMAGFPDRLAWWSPVVMGLSQRVDGLDDLAPIWVGLRGEVSGPQAVLAARCLGAFVQAQRQSRNLLARLNARPDNDAEIAGLLDSILIELDPRFEPSAATRALLAEALGQLPYPKVRAALRRQICERVLLIDDRWQYDQPIVRVAAARSLRDMSGSTRSGDDDGIDALLRAWRAGDTAATLEALDDQGRTVEERILAAFALSDLSDQPGVQRRLVELLLRPDGDESKKDWQAIQAAIADALVLEADESLADLLAAALGAEPQLPLRTEILVVGIVGACAGHRPALIGWLYGRISSASIPLVAGIARVALARAIACGQADGLPGAADATARDIEAQARAIIEEPIAGDAPMVATLRRLAIEALVWQGAATAESDPPAAIASWPVALRQSWWDAVGYSAA